MTFFGESDQSSKLPLGFQHVPQIGRAARTFPHQLPTPCLAAKQKAHLPSSARGKTPLHWAAGRGHDVIVERLLAAGADVNAVDNDGRGLGAGRVNPDFTQICRNLASEHETFSEASV